ncbi:MAG: ATP-binding cassette domain-containing protein [Alphaproteobacteria bacterium]|nr:ATP-binding cassette domain-containing protein [Alphaproteobacteria bacterium]
MDIVALDGALAGYGDAPVLRDLNLKIRAGERIAIVGESGAGKTTLLRLLRERSTAPVALVPQDLGLVQALTVFHNVYMGRLDRHGLFTNLRNLVWPGRRESSAVRALLDEVRLSDKLFTPVGQLSGGQRQRVAVARALYADAAILVGDEPVSAVDDLQARDILDLLGARKETVILALHDRNLALGFADRIVGLRGGRIVLDRPAAELSPADLDPLYKP